MFHRWISGSIRREFQTFRFHSLLKKHPVDARRSEGKERQGREERRRWRRRARSVAIGTRTVHRGRAERAR